MILYKYLSVEKAEEWLMGANSLLLTPPIYLNDVLEFHVRRTPLDWTEAKEQFNKFQQEMPSNLTVEEYYRVISEGSLTNEEPEAMRKLYSREFGVFSLSSDPLNELMWAHYGQNSGVAIGYPTTEPLERSGLTWRTLPLGFAIEVAYSNAAKLMEKDCSDAVRHLTTKRECWTYEKEWRIIKSLSEAHLAPRGDKKFYTLPAAREQIAHVVSGAQAGAHFVRSVLEWLKSSPSRKSKLTIDPVSRKFVLTNLESPA